MTSPDVLERRYRRWLRLWPSSLRREYEDEILGVLLTSARHGRGGAGPLEFLDLMTGGFRIGLRRALSRPACWALPLMYVGATLQVIIAFSILATAGEVRSILVERDLVATDAQWQGVMAGHLEPVALAAIAAAAVWIGLAWAIGRGHRSARFAFATLFGVNLFGLTDGLANGSAMYARLDLALGFTLCVVQLVVVALVFPAEFRRVGRLPSAVRRALRLPGVWRSA